MATLTELTGTPAREGKKLLFMKLELPETAWTKRGILRNDAVTQLQEALRWRVRDAILAELATHDINWTDRSGPSVALEYTETNWREQQAKVAPAIARALGARLNNEKRWELHDYPFSLVALDYGEGRILLSEQLSEEPTWTPGGF